MHRHPRLAGATGIVATLAVASAVLAQPVGSPPTATPEPSPPPSSSASTAQVAASPQASGSAVATTAPVAASAAPDAGGPAAEEPTDPGPPPRPTRERSPALAATGGLMVGFGFLGVLVGGGLLGLGLVEQGIGTCTDGVYGYSYHCGIGETGEDLETAGLVTMAIGGAVTLVGLPITFYGSTTVPRDEQPSSSKPRPQLRVGARSIGLSMPF